jgi:hypothetical protein
VDFLSKKAQEDPKILERVQAVVSLDGLDEHPGWAALRQHFEIGAERYMELLAKRLLAGEKVSEEEIAYHRGSIDIARAIFDYPTTALARLEATAQRGYAAYLEEQLSRYVEQSPFIITDQEVT